MGAREEPGGCARVVSELKACFHGGTAARGRGRGGDAQGDDGGGARAVDAEDGADLAGGGGLVEGRGAVPEGEDCAYCPVGGDDGAAVEGVEGEGVLLG